MMQLPERAQTLVLDEVDSQTERRSSANLDVAIKPDDVLAVWPPVAGG